MSPPGRRQRIGRWGEEVAARYLEERGCRIVARNVRTPYGEIDLIAEQGGVTLFVEVKARTSAAYGLPEESITAAKRTHLLNAIQAYWQMSEAVEGIWQVDVIAIQGRPGDQEVQIEHFENAFH